MDSKEFNVKIDSSRCTSMVEGMVSFKKQGFGRFSDVWRYKDVEFQSGKIYALVSEYGQGCMFLSYLLGGRVDFDELRIYIDGKGVTKNQLESISWNLEPSQEKYRNVKVKKSIEKALKNSNCKENSFLDIQKKFSLTEPRFNRKMYQLSGERWRASAALGYAYRRKIFFAPYKTSEFYYHMDNSGLISVLRNLANDNAIVVLPVGSDHFVKQFADKCIYLDRVFEDKNIK